jgi:signal transduction histidine kinase
MAILTLLLLQTASRKDKSNPTITTDRISRALGDAVVRVWGRLPHDLQSQLFDEVVAENEEMKGHLAVLLHEKHPRTKAGIQARAIVEPDSLGG